MNEVTWNPWHGCHKCSPGCQNCFVYALDARYGRDSGIVTRAKTNFDLPLKRDRLGLRKVPRGSVVKACFTSDFFIEEADQWREEAWDIIRQRPDLHFVIATKRIQRVKDCLPSDWGDGWDNITIAVSCENQAKADERIPIFKSIPIKHRYVFISPILEYVDLKGYLKDNSLERICVGGEAYTDARVCDFSWVEQIYIDCLKNDKEFNFHQTGSTLLIEGTEYRIDHQNQYVQAQKFEQYLINKYQGVEPNSVKDVIV